MNPKIFNRVKNAVMAFSESKQTNSVSNEPADFLRYGPRNKPLLQDWSQVEMSDQDMYTGYPYAVINKRANRAAALGKRFLYTEASKPMMEAAKKQGKELEHPYLQLIKKSKEFSTRKFWHDISTYLDLEGVYYLMAVRAVTVGKDGESKVGAVQKFSMINPYNIRKVIRESDGTIGGYVETKNGMYREIPKEMIIEIRLLNPFDNDLAYSMTDAAKESQFTMKQAGDYTRNSIKGNINAPGAITTEVQLEDHIFDNFVSRIQNHTKGEPLYGNGSGAVHWESMQIDLDKAALDKITDIHRSTLFAVSGVSDMLMGQQKAGTGREVSKTQKDEFTENAIMPQIEDITDALNLDYRKWYPEWEKNEFEILLDNPLEADREAELKDIEIRDEEIDLREKLVNMGYEYDIANKYAHGDISREELGQPTLEPKKTPEELALESAQAIAASKESASSTTTTTPKDTPAEKQAKAQTRAEEPKSVTAKETKTSTTATVSTANALEETSTADFKKAVNQVAARDIPDLLEGIEIDPRALTDDDYRGCIMMTTEKIPVAQYVKKAEKDLFENPKWDQGALPAETVPHTTLFYGLLNNGNTWKPWVDRVLSEPTQWKMDTVKINEVSYFDLPDSYAVVALLDTTPELLDAHGRLSLLPGVNTFSEYHPHITLAYVKKDVDIDKWITSLGKKYNGQIVSTKGLDYGDKPKKSDDSDNTKNNIESQESNAIPQTPKKSTETPFLATHSHDHHDHEFVPNSTMDKALNELDTSIKDQVLLQEADLQRAVSRVENDVAQAVIEALRNGNVGEAEDLITEAQQENFIAELAAIIAAYYIVLFPIYAAQLFAFRLGSFGQQGVFAMTDDVETYIKEAARRAAESHIQTIVGDFEKSVSEATDGVTQDELLRLVQEKANARDPEYMKLLPDNPNNEDVVKAVDSGKFDNHPAYKLARDLARQGLGLQEIEKAVQDTYTKMSDTRAKTIARHEASRVFNMSQYQADLQFLTESNNLPNAYKRLRSRTGDPCAVCNLLIQKTRKEPIPFTQNFADLGDELTATYKRPSGKTAVQKVPINYEAIAAGNVHVNCVTPDTIVKTDHIKDMVRSYYSGDIINLLTADGRRLGVTPNHIMLTSRGWVAAKNMRKGDEVVAYLDSVEVAESPADNNSPTSIEKQFALLVESIDGKVLTVPSTPKYLKGDAAFGDGEVDIIPVESILGNKLNDSISEFSFDERFVSALSKTRVKLVEGSNLPSVLVALGLISDGIVSRDGLVGLLSGAKPTLEQKVSLSNSSNYNSRILKSVSDSTSVDIELLSDTIKRLSSLVKFDKVVSVDIVPYSGHVYDVSSVSTLYTANSIITSNCNCEYELIIKRPDGTIINEIDIRTSNEITYNDFDPTQPRDGDGKWTDTGAGDTKPVKTMSPQDAAKGANPKYSSGSAYKNNCQKCVPTYELRRRGYDVEAGPFDSDAYLFDNVIGQARLWQVKEVDYNAREVKMVNGKPKVTEKSKKQFVEALKSYPQGARVQISYVYSKKRTGHTIMVEIVPKSEDYPLGMMFVDPQTGKIEKGISLEGKSKFSMIRLDNKEINPELVDKVVSGEKK